MIGRKGELVAVREKQLAQLRAKLGHPERVVLNFACAVTYQNFVMTFSRVPPATLFKCEAIEKPQAQRSIFGLKASGRQPDALNLAASEIELQGLDCPCGASHRPWVRCECCHAFVCGGRMKGNFFTCRDSCGSKGTVGALTVFEASRGPADGAKGAAGRTALGHSSVKALPRRG